jgi:hypothetical protein
MAKDYSETDARILAAIQSFGDIPTASSLSSLSLSFCRDLIQSRIEANPALRVAQEQKGIEYVNGLSEPEFIKRISRDGGSGTIESRYLPSVKEAINARTDAMILRAITGFNGIPNASVLSRIDGFFTDKLIQSRMDANPALKVAQEQRGIAYIQGLSEPDFIAQMSINGGLLDQSINLPSVKVASYARADDILFRTLASFPGIPGPNVLSELSGFFSNDVIRARMDANPALRMAQEQRGLRYVCGLSESEFIEQTAKLGGLIAQSSGIKSVQDAIYTRVDAILLRTIQGFQGIPTSEALGQINGFFDRHLIQRRIDSNPALREAQDKSGITHIQGLSEQDFVLGVSKRNAGLLTLSRYLPKIKEAIYERTDAIILKAIADFDGIPNANVLSKIDGFFSDRLILSRIDANPALRVAQENSGIKYIRILEEHDFIREVSKAGGSLISRSGSQPIQDAIYARIDSIILRELSSLARIQNYDDLSVPEFFGRLLIRDRVSKNPVLWAAYQEKKGLTADQAVELALERGEDHKFDAVKNLLSERLKSLFAFREMVGLTRVFSDLFHRATNALEVSLYPQPLKQALELERINLQSEYVALQTFKSDATATLQLQGIPDLAVVQGLHRLSEQSLNQLLSEAQRILPVGSNVLATYSSEFTAVENLPELLSRRGFELVEEGTGVLEVKSPSPLDLESAGVNPEDLSRMKSKIDGTSNVLHLVTKQVEDPTAVIPALMEFKPLDAGKGSFILSDGTIDIPEQALQDMKTSLTFATTGSFPSDSLLVTVIDGDSLVADVGFKMDPRVNGRGSRLIEVETGRCSAELRTDIRSLARRLMTNAEMRGALGVEPNKHTRVQLAALRH